MIWEFLKIVHYLFGINVKDKTHLKRLNRGVNPPTDERYIFLSVCPAHSSGRVRLQAGVGGGTGRLSGYNYLVSSANYTPSITTALYHGHYLHILTHPTRLPSDGALWGLD